MVSAADQVYWDKMYEGVWPKYNPKSVIFQELFECD